MKHLFILLFLYLTQRFGECDIVAYYECPSGWEDNADHCLRFIRVPELSREAALRQCISIGASLLSINSDAEHNFIVDKLGLYDGGQEKDSWWTSGRRAKELENEFYWEGDGTTAETYLYWMNSSVPMDMEKSFILYHFNSVQWGWILGKDYDIESHPYICEVSKSEIYKVTEEERGADYGQPTTDKDEVERGPKVTEQPVNTVHEPSTKEPQVSLNCVADGQPKPTYQWYKLNITQKIPIDPLTNQRYTKIDGKLIITSPEESLDAGNYQCTASNKYGAVLSDQVLMSFGYLLDFPKAIRTPVAATSYKHVSIECQPPAHYPGIAYTWYKNDVYNFMRSDVKPYIFISRSGRLYFSQVTTDDNGDYYCLVYKPGQYLGNGKVSMAIKLTVVEGSPGMYEPTIDSGFPAVFPPSPMVGDDLNIECWAYGSSDPPLQYKWSRIEKDASGKTKEIPMPVQASLSDHNRVLNIPNAHAYDAGTYRCHVERYNGASHMKDIVLTLKSKPYFIVDLSDEYVDEGSQLKWVCQAGGSPAPTYMWYKNATLFSNTTLPTEDRGRIFISNNLIHFVSLDSKRDNGTYQCAARNDYGTTYSAGELRVLGFPPNFAKYPLPSNQYATKDGNKTMQCKPEAAPYPEYNDIVWYKDGALLQTGDQSSTSRIIKFENGNLFFSPVFLTDAGSYECRVKNKYGQASTSGNLTVVETISISYPPYDTVIQVNHSAFLHCDASYDPAVDLAYVWYQNEVRIEFERIERLGENRFEVWYDPHFARGNGLYFGGLYIHNTKYWHKGLYTCIVESATGSISAKAKVDVIGPPMPPAGCYVLTTTITSSSVMLHWKVGGNNGIPVTSFVIEGYNYFEGFWKIVMTNVQATPDESETYSTNVTNLRPYSLYQLRVLAENYLGTSGPSSPSDIFKTKAVAPDKYPDLVGGGGGKEGDLTITWQPLDEWDWGAPGIGYTVYWRKYDEDEFTDNVNITGGTANHTVILVGMHNVYKKYVVSVRTFNDIGSGPISPSVTIRSAMGVPVAIASNVQAQPYNATACSVHWNPVEEKEEYLKGTLGGYRIRYWMECCETEQMSQRLTISGQANYGLVIGLWPDTAYYFDILIFNDAGNGPKSQYYIQRTLRKAPIQPPVEVAVERRSSSAIWVKWRGVSTTSKEEPLEGYKVRIWRDGTDVKSANDYHAGRDNNLYVDGLRSDVYYNLRVLGYSRGGDGTYSSPTQRFLLGAVGILESSRLTIILVSIVALNIITFLVS